MADQPETEEELNRQPTDEEFRRLQWTTILYDLHETNPDNGLVRDKTDPAAPCATLTHGWRPETGFLPYRWEGYDEGLLLYVLGLARRPIHCPRSGDRRLRRLLGPEPVLLSLQAPRRRHAATVPDARKNRLTGRKSLQDPGRRPPYHSP